MTLTRRSVWCTLLISAFWFASCSQNEPTSGSTASAGTATPAASGGSGSSGASGTGTFEIVCLGDSLTSGYGLLSDQAYPQLVQMKFAAEGYHVDVVNAGVSGDTSAGGLRRVEQLLTPDTKILVLALGGNDALRGLTTSQTHDNLAGIVSQAVNRNVGVLIAGIQPPPNLG